jgi:hypothetical protein
VPDLGGEPLQRRRRERECAEELRVAVARNHLRRGRFGLEAQPLAGEPLDLGIEGRVRPDGAGKLPDAVRLESGRDPLAGPVELERPAGELPAERDRLRVDAVRAADL